MSEEKNLENSQEQEEDFSSFVDFTDLEDLESVGDADFLSGLGDIGDLGGIANLDAILDDTDDTVSENTPESVSEETAAETEEVLSMDTLPGIDAIADDVAVWPEETAAENGEEAESADALDGLNLDFLSEESDAGQESLAAEKESDMQGLGSMLDGLLDGMDADSAIPDEEKGQETLETAAEGEEDLLSDLLGLADNVPDLSSGEEEAENISQDVLMPDSILPEETEKKPGFFKRVFGNIVTDEIAQQERDAAQKAEEDAAQKELEAEKEKEEKAAKKAEKQEKKEAQKAEKQKSKQAKKEEKAAKKAEKKAQREAEEEAEIEVVGKLNKVGVSIIVIATIAFLILEIAGTNQFGYISAKNAALEYFEMGKYTAAYQEAIGTSMKEKDEEDYNKIKVVMKVQQSLNAYENYERIQYYPDALDALLYGIKRYDANIEEAVQLGVESDMQSCRTQILTILSEEFGVSEQEAYSLLDLDEDAYTEQVVELGLNRK